MTLGACDQWSKYHAKKNISFPLDSYFMIDKSQALFTCKRNFVHVGEIQLVQTKFQMGKNQGNS